MAGSSRAAAKQSAVKAARARMRLAGTRAPSACGMRRRGYTGVTRLGRRARSAGGIAMRSAAFGGGWLLAAALLVAVAATGQTQPQQPQGTLEPAARTVPTQLERGAARYQRYCAACHGKEADGKGVMAASLR